MRNRAQPSLASQLLHELIALDFDALESYDAILKLVENSRTREALTCFREDHWKHIASLSRLSEENAESFPSTHPPRALVEGEVAMATLPGERALLLALGRAEDLVDAAYDRAARHEAMMPHVHAVVRLLQCDQHRRRAWILGRIESLGEPRAPRAEHAR